MRFKPDDSSPRHRLRPSEAAEEQCLFEQLGQGEPVPDLSGRIMNRLGYRRVPSTVARRRAQRRMILKGFASLFAIALVALGAHLHHHGPDARRPTGPTLQEAFTNDLDRHQQSFIRTIQTIRQLAPVHQEEATDDNFSDHQLELDEDVDRSAVGPVRWL